MEIFFNMPDTGDQHIELSGQSMKIGSLLSNEIVVESEGVDPIHALLEKQEGAWLLTNLSDAGVLVNGKAVSIEATLREGDTLTIGRVVLKLQKAVPLPPPLPRMDKASQPLEKETPAERGERRSLGSLFAPRKTLPSGDMLEVVAYWEGHVLDVEHFHPTLKGFDKVSIGDPTKTHFLAAGDEDIAHHVLAEVDDGSYTLHLLDGMTARVRSAGEVKELGPGTHELGRRDLTHVRFGPIHYFFLFMRLPELILPPQGWKDPLFAGMMAVGLLLWALVTGSFLVTDPKLLEEREPDLWSIVQLPDRLPEKKRPQAKPPVEVAELKTPPPPRETPPPPKPQPVKAVTPEEQEKPKPKPQAAPPSPPPRGSETLTKARTQEPTRKASEKPGQPKPQQFGNDKPGGQRKGNDSSNVMGVEGVNNKKSSGINLNQLGLGVGKVSSQSGTGAIYTKFKDSSGGAGGGTGSGGAKGFGLGGLGTGKSLGIAGAEQAVGSFGGGGLLKDSEVGGGFAREGVDVNVRGTDPLISGGLTDDQVKAVINANLNQIRHCYQQLLQKDPEALGRVRIKFIIGLTGRVRTSDVADSTFSDLNIQNCVSTTIKRWQFPTPRGDADVIVTYPFIFQPVT
ncbi:MAG: AgmX/PglI C-terminal domain-containing protein [Deltaproteobacteria bacterium]|nr:AgmX/PglI C-terminal domain-containing protein [Deltaproteobacteria bacterium]